MAPSNIELLDLRSRIIGATDIDPADLPAAMLEGFLADYEEHREEAERYGLVRVERNCSHRLLQEFAEHPSIGTLEAAVYAMLCNCHRGFYLPRNGLAFQQKYRWGVDCGGSSSALVDCLDGIGVKSEVLSFTAPSRHHRYPENQFTTFIRVGKSYYGVDQAAWCYGPPSCPWYRIVEAESLSGAIELMLHYFRTETREEDVTDRSQWSQRGGIEQATTYLEMWLSDKQPPGNHC